MKLVAFSLLCPAILHCYHPYDLRTCSDKDLAELFLLDTSHFPSFTGRSCALAEHMWYNAFELLL